ncbi:hypothetical protein Tco_0631891 [Tanacetum coccineum]
MDNKIRDKNAKFAAFQKEIDTLKQNLSKHVKEKESSSTNLTVFKTESNEKESKYIDKEIVLEKQNKKLENIPSQSEAKDTVIKKLKDRIKSISEKTNIENVKRDIDEIETINIELEHSVAKLLSEKENLHKEREHLKTLYKDQFESIKKTRVRSKEHYDSLIAQLNAKSVENSDLNAQLQEKIFANAAL